MRRAYFGFFIAVFAFSAHESIAHPGSGIVTDRNGNVYFVDTGSGVWKIDRAGTLTNLSGPAFHWMAIDVESRLANVTLPFFSSRNATVTRVGVNPTLLLSSDFPIAVGPDGSVYYPWHRSGDRVHLYRLSPSGTTTTVMMLPPARSKTLGIRWRNGVTVSDDGTIYYTEDTAIRKITPRGALETVVEDFRMPDCGSVAGVESELGAYFRGIAVDSAGNVFVAAAGCRAVIKITTDKKITTVLRASDPWSPTGIAIDGGDIYVLEYLHAEGDDRREWLPRVRKLSSNGKVTTIATVER